MPKIDLDKFYENHDDDEYYLDIEDYYDDRGKRSSGGLYDAGGHVIPERYLDYADFVFDSMRDSRE